MPGVVGTLRVAFVGAGGINFGTVEGPWNHSTRLEQTLGNNLLVTAIIDPAPPRRHQVLEFKRLSSAGPSYEHTKEYDSLPAYLHDITAGTADKPDMILIGVPPAFHGSTLPGKDMELALAKAIPNVTLFVEKPMSSSSVQDVMLVGKHLENSRNLISVGYFMRYLQVVQKMKQLIAENNLTVMSTMARYTCSYAHIAKMDWWMKSISCSPIVEQGTHFCDLSRYFGGDVDISSVQAHSVEHDEPPGHLSVIPIDESSIPPLDRVPRITTAIWKYTSGAVGTIVHGINLQGTKYNCELEVHADGWFLRMVDPYNEPKLYVRSPLDDAEQLYTFPEDDPYLSQMAVLVDAVKLGMQQDIGEGTGRTGGILSSWEDASKTYELTWAIRYAAEAQLRKRGGGQDVGQQKVN
ncbi:hypothetical protein SpCBS45565_g03101 [Spizellomyces sp. 'palustris']|nr:hypothetical protein SpCBS45565_g03101 [Spizellomyces sp. 'palustris']